MCTFQSFDTPLWVEDPRAHRRLQGSRATPTSTRSQLESLTHARKRREADPMTSATLLPNVHPYARWRAAAPCRSSTPDALIGCDCDVNSTSKDYNEDEIQALRRSIYPWRALLAPRVRAPKVRATFVPRGSPHHLRHARAQLRHPSVGARSEMEG